MYESVNWSEDGTPHSSRFKDRYHSCAGGLAQAATVFVAGCGLPGNWCGKTQFTVLETGFGLGLNFLSTWTAWETDPKRCDYLHFYSVEAYPVSSADMVRAVGASLPSEGDIADLGRIHGLAQQLAAVWLGLSPGIHTFHFAQGHVVLTLAVGDVGQVLPALDCQADAVFLDGFSPSINPDMWSLSTLQAVALHCRPGTTLASYTIAKDVREGLKQLGFLVSKCKGLPPKRDRLEAVFQPS
jgi:tRNA 5-methylaminomethyl-2-thiouridine biosynthesis bifunctional protein